MLLRTDRLLLRTAVVEDAVLMHLLWSERDPRVPVRRRIDDDGHPTVAELAEWIAQPEVRAEPGLLIVELALSGKAIGYCGLVPNSVDAGAEPELAFEFLQSVWGHGYATEAARAVIDVARDAGRARLWATVRDWNAASRRVLAKVGFIETGQVEMDPVHGDSILTTLDLGGADD